MKHKSKLLWLQDCLALHLEEYPGAFPQFVFKAYRRADDTWMDVQRLEMWDFAFLVSILDTSWKEILRHRLNMAGMGEPDGDVSEESEQGQSIKEG